jgi:(2Fe-2S) ferredoxin
MAGFEHHVFVCTNERDKSASRGSCGREHGEKLRGELKDAVKKAGLKHRVRVQETGCLDQCEHAAVMVVYPEAVWYQFVKPKDIAEIVEEHLLNGRPVERLRMQDSCLNAKDCPHIQKQSVRSRFSAPDRCAATDAC